MRERSRNNQVMVKAQQPEEYDKDKHKCQRGVGSWNNHGMVKIQPTKSKWKGQYHLKVKLTKGDLEVETTRLWSKPGLEVLAVPGTSMITCRLNKVHGLFSMNSFVKRQLTFPRSVGWRKSKTVPRTGRTSPEGISSASTGVYLCIHEVASQGWVKSLKTVWKIYHCTMLPRS